MFTFELNLDPTQLWMSFLESEKITLMRSWGLPTIGRQGNSRAGGTKSLCYAVAEQSLWAPARERGLHKGETVLQRSRLAQL